MKAKPTASTTTKLADGVARAAKALVDSATRILETLGPSPALQPIPVRVRDDRPVRRS